MLLSLSGRDVEFVGSADDRYFETLPIQAAGLDGLIALVSTLPDASIIFDVGANIGLSAVAMALAAPRATIYAFEPSPANLSYLRPNVAAFSNIRVVEAAISDAPGTLRFHEAGSGSGSHVVGISHIATDTPSVGVPAITLDAFAAENQLRPTLVKLDVEGHEPEALAGARRTLVRDRPWVFMEFNTFTLNVLAGHSPAAFARALWQAYDVDVINSPKPNAHEFLHDHFVKEHCIADLAMKPKAGHDLPSLAEMSFSPAALEAIRRAGRSDEDRPSTPATAQPSAGRQASALSAMLGRILPRQQR